jgi:hypothetical protein
MVMKDMDQFALFVKMACPNNEIIADDTGKPSVMVYIPKFKINQVIDGGSDKTHPAFIVDGVERDGFYISKYENISIDEKGYSLPGEIPTNVIGIERSRDNCFQKGKGWHLTTIQEWGAVALWCKKNGFLPHGNTDYGKDKRESVFKAVPAPYDKKTGVNRVKTGTGPLTWTHDQTIAGIWDLVGNLSEWVGGVRVVYGELQVLPDNNAANGANSQGPDSEAWRAIDAKTGAFIKPDGKGTTHNSVKADYIGEGWGGIWHITTEIKSRENAIRRCDMTHITIDESISREARELLYSYAFLPADPSFDYQEQHVYMNNGAPECYMYRGGYWGSGAFAGVFCWSLSWGRNLSYEGNGFRASYIPLD